MSSKRRHSMHKQVLGTSKRELEVSEGVYCRTCLVTDNLMSIFYGSDDEEKVSHNLKIVTGLEIKYNDGLSQKMCVKCLNTFNKALQFRRTCKKAEKTLLGLLSPKKKYDQPKLKKPKVEHEYSYEAINYDDFQNDEQFDSKDDVKPILVKKERKPQNARQKAIKIPNASSYKCGTCNKEFKMKATYKAHMRFHTNYCVCESCGKRCRNNHQLQEHKRARHGLGRIHKCAYCDYSSATKEALVIHERRHTGERPYICDHCGATFHRRSNLVQHIAIHLPDKNFQCDMCPKRLKSRKFLQIHKHNAHTGRRYGYLCAVCHHRFDKPNKCTFCPTREKSKKRLQIHISKAHRVKRFSYKCPCCSKLFQRSEHTHRHLTRVHHIPRDIHPPIEKIHTHYCNSDCTALTCSNYCDVTPTATDMCQNVV